MNKKTKKRIEVLRKKLDILRRQLAGAKKQTDEPGEVERLSSEVEQVLCKHKVASSILAVSI